MLVYQRVLFLILSPKTIGLAHGLNQQWIGIVGMEPKSNILERDGHDQTWLVEGAENSGHPLKNIGGWINVTTKVSQLWIWGIHESPLATENYSQGPC